MTGQSFSLIPFPAPNLPNISITGVISLQKNVLDLRYSLKGELDNIFLPPTSKNPRRRDELWKATCFELFMGIKDQPQYWEFNMSPSGDWNVYHMNAYRRIGFREETSIDRPQFETVRELDKFSLFAAVDLNPILQPGQLLEFGITTIVQTNDGDESYWALAHPASLADFHLRESFTLALAEQTHLSQ